MGEFPSASQIDRAMARLVSTWGVRSEEVDFLGRFLGGRVRQKILLGEPAGFVGRAYFQCAYLRATFGLTLEDGHRLLQPTQPRPARHHKSARSGPGVLPDAAPPNLVRLDPGQNTNKALPVTAP